MTTAQQLIRQAYIDIGKADREKNLTAEKFQDAVLTLNQIALSSSFIVDYTIVSSSSDEITAPLYSHMWLRKALAYDLACQHGVSEAIPLIAQQKKEARKIITLSIGRIGMPSLNSNVPLGIANRGFNHCDRRYYSESTRQILTEQGSEIITEDGTE